MYIAQRSCVTPKCLLHGIKNDYLQLPSITEGSVMIACLVENACMNEAKPGTALMNV